MKVLFEGCTFWGMLVLSGLLIWEWWLGRTVRVRASSTLELLFFGMVAVIGLLAYFFRRNKNG